MAISINFDRSRLIPIDPQGFSQRSLRGRPFSTMGIAKQIRLGKIWVSQPELWLECHGQFTAALAIAPHAIIDFRRWRPEEFMLIVCKIFFKMHLASHFKPVGNIGQVIGQVIEQVT